LRVKALFGEKEKFKTGTLEIRAYVPQFVLHTHVYSNVCVFVGAFVRLIHS